MLSAELGVLEGFSVRGGSAGSLVIGGDGGGASGVAVGFVSLNRREAQDPEVEGKQEDEGKATEEKEHRRGQQSALEFIHKETSPPRSAALGQQRERHGFPGSQGSHSPSWQRLSAETATWSLSLPAAARSIELALEGMLSGEWTGLSRATKQSLADAKEEVREGGDFDEEDQVETTEWVSIRVPCREGTLRN